MGTWTGIKSWRKLNWSSFLDISPLKKQHSVLVKVDGTPAALANNPKISGTD